MLKLWYQLGRNSTRVAQKYLKLYQESNMSERSLFKTWDANLVDYAAFQKNKKKTCKQNERKIGHNLLTDLNSDLHVTHISFVSS